jgi:hypothetical protein
MTTIVNASLDSDLIEEYCNVFSIAESHLKNAESFVKDKTIEGGILIPSLNEFRYAGCHAMRALASTLSNEGKIEEYKKAIAHCERASYDILDAQIQFYIKECMTFREDYKLITISNVIPDYLKDCEYIEQIKDDLKKYRDKKSRWQCIEEYLNDMTNILRKWNIAREELNKILREAIDKRWKDTKQTIYTVIGLIFTGIIVVAKIVCLFK